jgi:hypothetical protein
MFILYYFVPTPRAAACTFKVLFTDFSAGLEQHSKFSVTTPVAEPLHAQDYVLNRQWVFNSNGSFAYKIFTVILILS